VRATYVLKKYVDVRFVDENVVVFHEEIAFDRSFEVFKKSSRPFLSALYYVQVSHA